MSTILSIDTSTVAASAAVTLDGKILGEEYTSYKLKHSEKLLPLVKHLLEDVRLELKDIDCFAVGNGPGSFTGLRISASTVKAFAQVEGKKIVSVSSLDACAHFTSQMCAVSCVMFDAQRNDVYHNIYVNSENGAERVNRDDSIISVSELLERLKGYDSVMFSGDGVFKCREEIAEVLGSRALFAPEGFILPRAGAVGLIAEKRLEAGEGVFDYDTYLPNYIRPSAAEEQRRKRKML